MFLKISQYTGILIVALVLLGHHSIQAQVMEGAQHHEMRTSCEGSECNHEVEMDFCEKIQNDQMQTSSQFFVLPAPSHFRAIRLETERISCFVTQDIHRNTPIPHQQLARSHLSM